MKKSQNALLERAYVALHNAMHQPELQQALARYGYDADRLQKGFARHTSVKQLTHQREQATQKAGETLALYQQSKEKLVSVFQTHREVARLAYKHETKYTDYLKLTGARQTATTDLLMQAETFYANVPTAMMEKYRVPRRELTETAKLVTRVRELRALQRHTQSQVQTLTQTRLQALEDLQTWMRRFMTVAKVALEEHPQQLEALNRTVTS